MLVIGLDITQRKQAEAELHRTLAREKELGQLRSNFVSMVSHEFRTPLGIIQSSAEILEDYLDQLEPAERKEHLQSIRKNTRRMASLMEEVLLIGSLEAGKMEFKPALAGAGDLRAKAGGRSALGHRTAMSDRTVPGRNSCRDSGRQAFAAAHFHEFANQRREVFGPWPGGAVRNGV